MANQMRLTLQLNAVDNMSRIVQSAAMSSKRSLDSIAANSQKRAMEARSNMFESGMLATAGAAALAFPLKMAANYEMLRIRMIALTQSQTAGMRLYGQTVKLASETPLTLDQVATATTRLIGFGRSAQQAIVDVKMLGDVVTLAGGDIDAAMVAYGQAAGEGRVMTRDLTQFVNAGVPIFKMLGEVTGANGAELKKMAEQGQLSFSVLEEAFRKSTSAGGQFADGMAKMSKSASGGWVRMIDEVGRLADAFGSSVLPMLVRWNEALIPIIAATGEFFRRNELLAKSVMFAVGAFTAFATIGLILNGIIWVSSSALAGYAAVVAWTGWQTIWTSNVMWTFRILLWGVQFAAMGAMRGLLAMGRVLIFTVTPAIWAAVAPLLAFLAPIALVAALVVALGLYIAVAINRWEDFGASMLFLMGPIGWIVNGFVSIYNSWEYIKKSFSSGGVLNGLHAIGRVLFDSVLYPLQQLLGIIERVTGFEWVAKARVAVESVRYNKDLDTVTQSPNSTSKWNVPGIIQQKPITSDIGSVQNNRASNNSATVNYSPTITIGSGVSKEDKESFTALLERHKLDLARMVGEVTRSDARKQFSIA